MSHSINEIESLGAKAARGAGAPPEQATRFGKALVCHLAANRPITDLTAALAALPKGPILCLALTPDTSLLGQSYQEAQSASQPTRIDIDANFKAQLTKLAHKTYVPASEASRSAGAGAGLTDND